jgi:hypothetical protein
MFVVVYLKRIKYRVDVAKTNAFKKLQSSSTGSMPHPTASLAVSTSISTSNSKPIVLPFTCKYANDSRWNKSISLETSDLEMLVGTMPDVKNVWNQSVVY